MRPIMKKAGIFVLLLCFSFPILAQEKTELVLQIVSDSAFVRAVPDTNSDAVASVFANEALSP
jgi:hypothetical protein